MVLAFLLESPRAFFMAGARETFTKQKRLDLRKVGESLCATTEHWKGGVAFLHTSGVLIADSVSGYVAPKQFGASALQAVEFSDVEMSWIQKLRGSTSDQVFSMYRL